MPKAWQVFQFVQFVAAMVEGNVFHQCLASRERELRWFEWMMPPPIATKLLQHVAVRNPDARPLWKVF